MKNISLVIDGGNFIHNGYGTAITTNRLISENETLYIGPVKDILKKEIGIQELIILPVEPGDETGHIDGMVRFLDRETVVVSEYPEEYREGRKFMGNVAKMLKAEIKNEPLRVINSEPVENNQRIGSAFGNYLNFLGVGNTIFLPQYGNDLDEQAQQVYEQYAKVIPIERDIKKLSELGGVLNCITWNY